MPSNRLSPKGYGSAAENVDCKVTGIGQSLGERYFLGVGLNPNKVRQVIGLYWERSLAWTVSSAFSKVVLFIPFFFSGESATKWFY